LTFSTGAGSHCAVNETLPNPTPAAQNPGGEFCAVEHFPKKIPKNVSGLSGGGNAAAETNLLVRYGNRNPL
jgi:hypothetical protein